MKAIPRNSPCPCGSGEKYKACCAVKRTRSHWAVVASVALFGVAAVWVVASMVRNATDGPGAAPPGKVWSEQHGHWHDVAARPSRPAGAPAMEVAIAAGNTQIQAACHLGLADGPRSAAQRRHHAQAALDLTTAIEERLFARRLLGRSLAVEEPRDPEAGWRLIDEALEGARRAGRTLAPIPGSWGVDSSGGERTVPCATP